MATDKVCAIRVMGRTAWRHDHTNGPKEKDCSNNEHTHTDIFQLTHAVTAMASRWTAAPASLCP